MSVCYSQEGVLHTLENALEKNTVVVWDVERHEKRYTYVEKEWEIEEALFSSSAHFVVAGAKEWAVWSPGDTNPRKLPHLHVGVPNSVAFSQDGKKLAAGGYGSTLFWDIANPMQPLYGTLILGKKIGNSVSTVSILSRFHLAVIRSLVACQRKSDCGMSIIVELF